MLKKTKKGSWSWLKSALVLLVIVLFILSPQLTTAVVMVLFAIKMMNKNNKLYKEMRATLDSLLEKIRVLEKKLGLKKMPEQTTKPEALEPIKEVGLSQNTEVKPTSETSLDSQLDELDKQEEHLHAEIGRLELELKKLLKKQSNLIDKKYHIPIDDKEPWWEASETITNANNVSETTKDVKNGFIKALNPFDNDEELREVSLVDQEELKNLLKKAFPQASAPVYFEDKHYALLGDSPTPKNLRSYRSTKKERGPNTKFK